MISYCDVYIVEILFTSPSSDTSYTDRSSARLRFCDSVTTSTRLSRFTGQRATLKHAIWLLRDSTFNNRAGRQRRRTTVAAGNQRSTPFQRMCAPSSSNSRPIARKLYTPCRHRLWQISDSLTQNENFVIQHRDTNLLPCRIIVHIARPV